MPDFSPSVFEHAARVIHRAPYEVSRDPELLFEAHAAAYELYRHSPVIIGIDIYNIEAEAFGATIAEPVGTGIPAIVVHPFSSPEEILRLAPFDPAAAGRAPMLIKTARRLARAYPGAQVRVPVSGPFSIACNLMGFDNLLESVLTDPGAVREALLHLAMLQSRFCAYIHAQGLGISFFESAAAPPLLSPSQFEEIEFPALLKMISAYAEVSGSTVPCVIGGDTVQIISSILLTGAGYIICPSETDQEAFMSAMREYPDVTVRINMNPGAFTSDDLPAAEAEADRVLGLAGRRSKVCVGTGVLPYEAIPSTVLHVAEYISQR